jgi:hypothetical protein
MERALSSDDKTDDQTARGLRPARIAPGTYTLDTLPPLSAGAKKILDELQAEEEAEKKLTHDLRKNASALSLQKQNRQVRSRSPRPGRMGVRLSRSGGVGLRLAPPKK